MVKLLKDLLRDALCTGKQLASLLLLAAGTGIIVCGPIWGLIWLIGGIR